MRLDGKKAAVTGGARGIGRGIAVKLAREGADIVVSDVDAANAERVAAEVLALGRKAAWVAADISDPEQARSIVRVAIDKLGGLDILVNCAGINRDAMVHKMTQAQWDEVIAVNLTGTFNCMRAAIIHMRERGYGRIINISSASWLGNVGQANYSASKAGVIGLTKTAARELAAKGVTVNAICPGFIETDMTRGLPEKIWNMMVDKIPMKRVGTPEDVANVVAFLSSDEASYVTAEVINVGGGMVL